MKLHESMPVTPLEALRAATRESHEKVDALFGSCDLATDVGYVRFLVSQAAAWETLRPVLSNLSRARADALIADLAALDQVVPRRLPGRRLPVADSIGLRYVLEGSRLGSTVLLRRLEKEGSARSLAASRYFRTSADISPWKQLSTSLQTAGRGTDRITADINDALFVFGLFEKAWWATDSVRRKVEPAE